MNAPGRLQTPILVGLTAIYAVCFVLIKAGLAFAPPLLFGGLRALIGGGALFVLMMVLRQPLLPPRGSWGGALALALTFFVILLAIGLVCGVGLLMDRDAPKSDGRAAGPVA